ncbi:histidine kinase dimerization/phospho-acceptor domain-containing protein [Streptomyces sp. NPDC054940]
MQDAAQELRTPLTILRASAEVLGRGTELAPDARDRLLDDVEGETRELGLLVDELSRDEAKEPSNRPQWPGTPRSACTGARAD